MKKIILLIIIVITVCNHQIVAKKIDTTTLPKLLGSGNTGNEFYLTFHPGWTGGTIKIYILSEKKANIVLEVEGRNYIINRTILPNVLTEFEITANIVMPYIKSPTEPPQQDTIYKDCALHITSDEPITCCNMYRDTYCSDAYLGIPINKWGKKYIVSSYNDLSTNQSQWLPSYTSIIGGYDNTNVNFTLWGNDSTQTAGGIIPGQTKAFSINKGDVLLLGGLGQGNDLSGSRIEADKPIGVISGSYGTYVPNNCGCADYLIEMEIPTEYWGNYYHVSSIKTRTKKNSIIRIYSQENDTKIYKDGALIFTLNQFGGFENEGYLSMRSDTGNARPVVISSNKPISITQYNTGQQDETVIGDPFQMILLPYEQYHKSLITMTPMLKTEEQIFDKNVINLIFESENGEIPNDFQIEEYSDSLNSWATLTNIDTSTAVPFLYNIENKKYYQKFIELPNEGSYRLTGDKPFMAYMYGLNWGYPASLSLKSLKDLEAPSINYQYNYCYNQIIGTATDMPNNEHRKNLNAIELIDSLSYNASLEVVEIVPGETIQTNWYLEVKDKQEDMFASVIFSDNNENDTILDFELYVNKISLTPNEFNFGKHEIGDSIQQEFLLINFSDVKPLRIQRFEFLSGKRGYEVTDKPNLPFYINPGDTIDFHIKFICTKYGEFEDMIIIGDTCGNDFISNLTIDVKALPTILAEDYNFGHVNTNDTISKKINITNSGKGNLLISGFTQSDSTYLHIEFPEVSIDNPLVIEPSATYTYDVTLVTQDSIGFNNSYITFHSNSEKTDSTADFNWIVEDIWPIIVAEDIEFGSVNQDTTIQKNGFIKNTGISVLIIDSLIPPLNNVFSFNIDLPCKILPDSIYTYIVNFTSDSDSRSYLDSIIFISNTYKNDRIALLMANVITSVSDGINLNKQNLSIYPNPFSGKTKIIWNMLNSEYSSLEISNIIGKNVSRIYENIYLSYGQHSIEFDSADLPAGIYFCTLKVGGYSETVKMVVIR